MKRRRPFPCGALLAALPLVPVNALAAPITFNFNLTPEAVGATGSGSGSAILDTALHTLVISASWSGLSGLTTVAHIHCCTANSGTGSIGVAVTPGTLPGFPVGTTSGSYASGPLPTDIAATYTAGFLNNFGGGTVAGAEQALLQGLQSGAAYLNIHSERFPGGEIRGFASAAAPPTAVPEPSTLLLMISAGVGLLVARRRAT